MVKKIRQNRGNQNTPVSKERQHQNGGLITEIIHENNASNIYAIRHRARFECVLDAYLWHQIITKPEYDAGQKLSREYQRSVLKIKIGDSGAGSRGDPEMRAISAINSNKVLQQAFAILTQRQREILIQVCVDNYRAGSTFRRKSLIQALDILVDHWQKS